MHLNSRLKKIASLANLANLASFIERGPHSVDVVLASRQSLSRQARLSVGQVHQQGLSIVVSSVRLSSGLRS